MTAEIHRHLADLIEQYGRAKNKKWDSGKFRGIKALSATEKGNIAEDFTVWMGECYGHAAHKNASKRGEWDVKIARTTLEVKMATEDVHGKFQFNGIRYDTKYDLLMVIGISPDDVMFNLYKRKDLMDLPLVNMQKGTNATYKLTRNPGELFSPHKFGEVFAARAQT